MKNLITFLLLFSVAAGYGQLISPVPQYENDRNGSLYNGRMLNVFFADKITTAFSGSNDLSTQKFYASLDAADNSLSLGVNIDSRGGNKLERLNWLFSTGLKMKSKDKFATLYKSGDFQEDNVGFTLKVSLIGRGIIWFNGVDNLLFRQFHNDISGKYTTEVAQFNATQLASFVVEKNALNAIDPGLPNSTVALQGKTREMYAKLAQEEVDFLNKNKSYTYSWNHWASLEAFIPFGENSYMTTSNKLIAALSKKTFYAFSLTGSYNMMLESSNGQSLFLKIKGILKNNNNIVVDNLKSSPFQTTITGLNNTLVVVNSEDGYETNFQQFLTPSITFEPAIFIFKNTVGFSPLIEFNTGKYKKTNWKLGIPFSFKDSKGEKAVNFEVQWKEINTFDTSVHYIGVSTNFLFGELIK